MKRAKRNNFRTNGPSISLLQHKAKTRFCIAVLEEMGVNGWLWFPSVDQTALEAYWSARPVLSMEDPDGFLNGQLISSSEFYGNDTSLRLFSALWRRLHVPGRYTADVCCDNDSYLQAPDGRVITHAGCTEEFRAMVAPVKEEMFPSLKNRYFKGRLKAKLGKDRKRKYYKRSAHIRN